MIKLDCLTEDQRSALDAFCQEAWGVGLQDVTEGRPDGDRAQGSFLAAIRLTRALDGCGGIPDGVLCDGATPAPWWE